MPEVVTTPAAAAPAPTAAVEAAPAEKAAPKDRMAAALEQLHKGKDAEPAKAADKPAEAKAESPAPTAEDPAEKLHVAMSKLNQREANLRQREQAVKQQVGASAAEKAELQELRAWRAQVVENPREAIRKAAGEDKEHEVFDRYVGQVAQTPEQRRMEEMQARLDKFERERVEGEQKSQTQKQNEHVANVVRDYKGGIAQQLQTAPDKFVNANVAVATQEIFEIAPGRYGGLLDLAVDVADKFALKTKQFMPHATALELCEKWLTERETQRTTHRQKIAKPTAAEEVAAEDPKKAAPAKARTVTVRHTLSNGMQGNAPARATKSGKSMTQTERLQNALAQLRR